MSSPHSSEDIYGEILSVFEHTSHPNEPLTSPEIADALDCHRRTAYRRLETLVDQDALRTKKVGSSGRVWWRPPPNSPDEIPTAPGTGHSTHQPLDAEQATTSRYQRFVEQNRVGICIIQDDVVKYVNPTFTDILGYTPDEALGEPVLDFVAEDEREMVAEHLRQREHGEIDVIRYEGRGKHADGTAVDVEIHGDLIEYEGAPAILGTLVDMSERKQRERELEESERRYRTLAKHFPNGVVALFDHDLRYTLAAGSLTDEGDFSPENLEGRRVGETASDARDCLEAHSRAALSGEKRTFEFEWDGGVRQAWTLPVTDETGSVFAGMLMTQDITDRIERERELEDYRTAVETVRDGVYMTDANRRFTMVNEAYCELTGYSRKELLGAPFSQVVDDEEVSYSADLLRELRAGERVVATTDSYHATPDGERIPVETRFTIRPDDDDTFQGTTGVVRDITDRLERERELREQRNRYRRLVETSSASIVIYTAEGTIAYVNDAATDRLAVDTADDLLGEAAIEFVHPDDRLETVKRIQRVIDERKAHFPQETKLIDANGRLKYAILTSTPIMHEGQPAAQVVINDITERKQRERQLEQYERIVETVRDGVYAVDENARFVTVNEAFCEMVGREREELLGQQATTIHDDVITPRAEELAAEVADDEHAVATIEVEFHTTDGERIPAEGRLRPFPIDGGVGRCGVIRDITERKARELELERYETIFETVNDGVYAVDAEQRFTMANEAYAEMVGYEREALRGEHVSLVADETVVTTSRRIEREMKEGKRNKPTIEATLRRADGESITAEAAFSLLPGEDTHERVGVVRDITERKEQERQLEHQRQELAALNHLQSVALNVSDQVLEQSTRIEMEQRVCERLAASNVYDFAWIGRTTRSGRELTVNAASQTIDDLADITVSLDATDPTGQGPIAQAVATQSVHVSRTRCEDPAYERWCEECDSRGHSVITVPIAYDGRHYGVLALYTERSPMISDTEQALIRQLAEIVGHAITALERGKSLQADRMIEVEYCSTALADPLVAAADGDLELASDRAISLGDDGYLHYYTIDGITSEQCMELVDEFPSVVNARVLVADGNSVRVAVRTTGETLASLFARFDGRTKATEITDSGLRIVGELPETANVREVTAAITERYPDMTFVGQRHVPRQQVSPEEFRTVIEDSLTDRQRTVLEAACYAGFFDYPRESSGEEVADSLDISSSTFHQHLRKAEKKLLDVLFVTT